ncbi:PaaI family thioesterase [Pseudomonas sp. JH-2]|uniref:PaaI family thioesterase n=1 Tax=Pseudomonas sp. JH-2 TaxID=3114998 RepID=UPI002E275DAB|nr:PaaI family thioesterase [Pseudomonas sp. JH-2]
MNDSTLAAAPAEPASVFPTGRFTFQEFLGLERWAEGEVARIRLRHRPELMNYLEHFHGGVLMSVLDAAMAGAIRICSPGCSMVTIDMATHFMGSTRDELNAVGRVLRRTRTLCFCAAEIRDEAGELVATATGSFKYRPAQAGAVQPTRE